MKLSPASAASLANSPDRTLLLQRLVEAERHVAEGERHLAKQEALIAGLDRDGHGAEEARTILDTLRETLIYKTRSPLE